MKVDKESIESILQNVCGLGNIQALRFLISTVPRGLLVDRLFQTQRYNSTPIESAVRGGQLSIAKELFSIDEVMKRYRSDDAQLFRLIFSTIGRAKIHEDIIDLVVTKLNLPAKKYIELLDYEYYEENRETLASGSHSFHRRSIVSYIGWNQSNNGMKMLISLIGAEEFVKRVFMADNGNNTILENAVRKQNIEMINIILSYQSVKQTYKTNKNWLFRLLFWLFRNKKPNEETIDCVVNLLELSSEDIVSMMHNFDYKESNENDLDFDAWSYKNKDITSEIGWSGNANTLQKLIDVIGENEFEKLVFIPSYNNTIIIETATRKNKVEILKILFGFESIKKVYLNDDYWIYRLVYWMQRDYKKEVCNFIVKELNLTKEKLLKYVNEEYEFKEQFVNKVNCNFVKKHVKCFVLDSYSRCVFFLDIYICVYVLHL